MHNCNLDNLATLKASDFRSQDFWFDPKYIFHLYAYKIFFMGKWSYRKTKLVKPVPHICAHGKCAIFPGVTYSRYGEACAGRNFIPDRQNERVDIAWHGAKTLWAFGPCAWNILLHLSKNDLPENKATAALLRAESAVIKWEDERQKEAEALTYEFLML